MKRTDIPHCPDSKRRIFRRTRRPRDGLPCGCSIRRDTMVRQPDTVHSPETLSSTFRMYGKRRNSLPRRRSLLSPASGSLCPSSARSGPGPSRSGHNQDVPSSDSRSAGCRRGMRRVPSTAFQDNSRKCPCQCSGYFQGFRSTDMDGGDRNLTRNGRHPQGRALRYDARHLP